MTFARKKAILRFLTREWAAGYVAPEEIAQAQQAIPFLDLSGKFATWPLTSLKWVCFVREFSTGDRADPERLLRRSFAARPRIAGLWLRLWLADGETLEGVAANDVSLLNPVGLFLAPPDTRANTQRLFLPRAGIQALEVVAVIGAAGLARRRPKAEAKTALQENLFRSEF